MAKPRKFIREKGTRPARKARKEAILAAGENMPPAVLGSLNQPASVPEMPPAVDPALAMSAPDVAAPAPEVAPAGPGKAPEVAPGPAPVESPAQGIPGNEARRSKLSAILESEFETSFPAGPEDVQRTAPGQVSPAPPDPSLPPLIPRIAFKLYSKPVGNGLTIHHSRELALIFFTNTKANPKDKSFPISVLLPGHDDFTNIIAFPCKKSAVKDAFPSWSLPKDVPEDGGLERWIDCWLSRISARIEAKKNKNNSILRGECGVPGKPEIA
jgi:hypothetical protein